jgi:hypothetical protein
MMAVVPPVDVVAVAPAAFVAPPVGVVAVVPPVGVIAVAPAVAGVPPVGVVLGLLLPQPCTSSTCDKSAAIPTYVAFRIVIEALTLFLPVITCSPRPDGPSCKHQINLSFGWCPLLAFLSPAKVVAGSSGRPPSGRIKRTIVCRHPGWFDESLG